jgi:hypothetical protein
MTEKFTGADLANLAREAALCAIEEEDEKDSKIEAVCMRHIEKAISSGSSKASPEPPVAILQMYNAFSRRGFRKQSSELESFHNVWQSEIETRVVDWELELGFRFGRVRPTLLKEDTRTGVATATTEIANGE